MNDIVMISFSYNNAIIIESSTSSQFWTWCNNHKLTDWLTCVFGFEKGIHKEQESIEAQLPFL
eukprot:COSAG06_NODE_37905_length_429_cov_4.051515_1_plen_62_part_10